MGILSLLIASTTPIFMPHFFNLYSVKPLRWMVTEFAPGPARLSSVQLTGRHMHAQPAVVRFKDGSVACAFFDNGKLINLEQLHPSSKPLSLSDQSSINMIPEMVERVPVPHIKRHEENIENLQRLVESQEPLSKFADKE